MALKFHKIASTKSNISQKLKFKLTIRVFQFLLKKFYLLTSKEQSMSISVQSPGDLPSQSSNFISKCLQEYQQKLNQQNEFSQYDSQQQTIPPQQILADEQSLKYYGYEDKKSITIKPIKMRKDLISQRKQNAQKKKIIQELQKQNSQLKNNYGNSIKQNHKVEKFLKDIEFTFKNDKKAQKANEIMLKAKKMLYRQALQCQNNAKKITKGTQANSVQEIKMYIQFLQVQKERLRNMTQVKKKENQLKREEQDFNKQNEQKFQQTLQRVQKMLNIEMQRTDRHHQIYKIQKGKVFTGLKQKQIMLKKKSIQKYYQKLKDLMLKKQGQEYEIVVLQKKRKDKIKLIQEMKQFKSDITLKKGSIQQLQKELKEKMKTYDYMSKWTKELKVKLEEKKQHHISNKISYEKKINALSRQFEESNKKYKLQMVEEQLGAINASGGGNNRKKGASSGMNNSITSKELMFGQSSTLNHAAFGNSKEFSINNREYLLLNGNNREILCSNINQSSIVNSKKAKLIKIDQVKKIVKKIKMWVLIGQVNLQHFLNTQILYKSYQSDPNQISHDPNYISHDPNHSHPLKHKDPNMLGSIYPNVKKASTINNNNNYENASQNNQESDPNQNSQDISQPITLKQLYDNLKSHIFILKHQPDSQIMKLARYIVEDHQNSISYNNSNTIKTTDGYVPNLAISKKLALTIMKKLFQNQLQTHQQVEQTKLKLREFLTKFYDSFRYDILKMLLHMDGLKGIQKQKIQEDKCLANSSSPNDNRVCGSQANGSQMMSNMKRNQQLHLQLELDEAIFLNKLKKHVVEQYYVARFKQVFDLMIYEEFGEIDRPRLGMFDRVCEIVTQKKLIKQNVTKEYNFDTIKSFDECQDVKEDKQLTRNHNNEPFSKEQQLPKQTEIVIKTQKDNDQQDYWIVKQKKRISAVQKVDNCRIKQNCREFSIAEGKDKEGKEKGSSNKYWLDDLMSDGDGEDVGM